MLRALYTSASGMQGQQMNLDVIANNLANVNTTGFKKSKVEFQDLLYQTNRAAGAEAGAGNQVPTSLQIGHGARPVATPKVFTNGESASILIASVSRCWIDSFICSAVRPLVSSRARKGPLRIHGTATI